VRSISLFPLSHRPTPLPLLRCRSCTCETLTTSMSRSEIHHRVSSTDWMRQALRSPPPSEPPPLPRLLHPCLVTSRAFEHDFLRSPEACLFCRTERRPGRIFSPFSSPSSRGAIPELRISPGFARSPLVLFSRCFFSLLFPFPALPTEDFF